MDGRLVVIWPSACLTDNVFFIGDGRTAMGVFRLHSLLSSFLSVMRVAARRGGGVETSSPHVAD